MHRSILAEGFDTHPCCDRSVAVESYTGLECVTELLGATLLAESAHDVELPGHPTGSLVGVLGDRIPGSASDPCDPVHRAGLVC